MGELREDNLGTLWEHYVLNEILGRGGTVDVRHWRTTRHQEVDFVLARRGRDPIAIECTWHADGREDLRGLKAFRPAYPKGESLVVASNVERPFQRELLPGVRVRYVGIPEVAQVVTPGQARPR